MPTVAENLRANGRYDLPAERVRSGPLRWPPWEIDFAPYRGMRCPRPCHRRLALSVVITAQGMKGCARCSACGFEETF